MKLDGQSKWGMTDMYNDKKMFEEVACVDLENTTSHVTQVGIWCLTSMYSQKVQDTCLQDAELMCIACLAQKEELWTSSEQITLVCDNISLYSKLEQT